MKPSAVLIGIVLVALSMPDFGMAKTTSGSGGGASGGSTRAAASRQPMSSGFASRSGGIPSGGKASGASAANKSMGSGFSQSAGATSNAAPLTSSPATKKPSFGSFGSDAANAPHPSESRSNSALTRDLEIRAANEKALARYDATKATPSANEPTIPGRNLARGGAATAPAAPPRTLDRAVAPSGAGPSQAAGDSSSNDALWGVAAGYILSRSTPGDAGAHGGVSQPTATPGVSSGDSPVTGGASPTGPIAEVGIAGGSAPLLTIVKCLAAVFLFIAILAYAWYFFAYVVQSTRPREIRETKSTYSLK
jgi:hypothetical protein